MTPAPEGLILFDGICNLCTSTVRFVIRSDKQARFRFLALQTDLGKKICRDAGINPEDIQTFLLFNSGRILTRSDAALEIARQLGGAWNILLVLKLIPRAWRDGLYAFVARRRYRLFGRQTACMVPPEEFKKRFLT